MTEYRWHFIVPTREASSHSARLLFEDAEAFEADSDDEARIEADALYRAYRLTYRQIQGYEVWQAGRLVYRHPFALCAPDSAPAGRRAGGRQRAWPPSARDRDIDIAIARHFGHLIENIE